MKAGAQIMRGYAWAPKDSARKVDIRVNGGRWETARIIDSQPNRYTWVRFEYPFNPASGDYVLETRATDNNGNVQPATVLFNKGGYDFFAIPKFHIRFV